jgi:hypothetical protein
MTGGLTAAYSPERCPNDLPFGKWTIEELTHPKTIVKQIIANILGSFKNQFSFAEFKNLSQTE